MRRCGGAQPQDSLFTSSSGSCTCLCKTRHNSLTWLPGITLFLAQAGCLPAAVHIASLLPREYHTSSLLQASPCSPSSVHCDDLATWPQVPLFSLFNLNPSLSPPVPGELKPPNANNTSAIFMQCSSQLCCLNWSLPHVPKQTGAKTHTAGTVTHSSAGSVPFTNLLHLHRSDLLS